MTNDVTNIDTPHTPGEMKRLKEVAAMVKSATNQDILKLKDIALHDANPKVRYYAKKGLLVIKRKRGQAKETAPKQETSPDQVHALLRDPSADRRMEALKAIARQRLNHLVAEVSDLVAGETDVRVKATMASLLGRMGSPAHIAVLRPLLKDADARVRANTVGACVRLDVEQAAPDIIPLLKDEDNRCRANAVAALKELGSDEVMETLGGMLASRAVHMQESAAFVLDIFPFARIKHLLTEGAGSDFAIVRDRIRALLEHFADQGNDEAAELFMTLFPEEDDEPAAAGNEPEKDAAEEIFKQLGGLESMSSESAVLEQQQQQENQLVGNLAALSEGSFGSYEDVVRSDAAQKEEVHRKLDRLKEPAEDKQDTGEPEDEPLLRSLQSLSADSRPVKDFSYHREIDIKPNLEVPAEESSLHADPGEEVFEKLTNIG